MTDEELLIWLRVEDTNLTDFAADRIEALIAERAKAVKLIDLAVELARWDRAPKLRDDMIDFTTEIKGESQDGMV